MSVLIIKDEKKYARDMKTLAWAYRDYCKKNKDDRIDCFHALTLLELQTSIGAEIVDTYILERREKEALHHGWIQPDWRDNWGENSVARFVEEGGAA